MKIETHARAAENPRTRAARVLLIYFAVTKGTVQYSSTHLCTTREYTAVYSSVHNCVLEKSIYSCTVRLVTAK